MDIQKNKMREISVFAVAVIIAVCCVVRTEDPMIFRISDGFFYAMVMYIGIAAYEMIIRGRRKARRKPRKRFVLGDMFSSRNYIWSTIRETEKKIEDAKPKISDFTQPKANNAENESSPEDKTDNAEEKTDGKPKKHKPDLFYVIGFAVCAAGSAVCALLGP